MRLTIDLDVTQQELHLLASYAHLREAEKLAPGSGCTAYYDVLPEEVLDRIINRFADAARGEAR